MPRSHWKLHLNASTESSAKKIVNRCIKLLGRPPIESKIEKYHKGGYMAILQFYHDDKLEWPEIIYEVISFSEHLGIGWVILGSVSSDPCGVLSMETSAKISVSGLLWAEWQVINEEIA